MAPNKIYVTESIYGNTMMQVADEESVEYINKEYFLDWLKEQHATWSAEVALSNDDGDRGEVDAYAHVINKLTNI